ncbi:hypothetical protein [Methylorubrum extorquens]|uniref:Uncharacterized protein n=1 Tax=Methylorubrum extorquens DSM 13060 TaxID=882800 RepID=H1KC36_METEX|nr:hypothetical protein [Methylorubrum extorquens]EHP94853.1 hypothetical protein MetexDRAFT_0198 [Methylorubrum extorquens DSM 13060]
MLIYHDPSPENIRSVIAWTAFLLGCGYVTLNAVLPNNDLNIAVDILIGVMATLVLGFYFWTFVLAIWTGSRKNTDFLIVGIALSWMSQDGQAWLRVILRMSGFSPAFANSELFVPIKLLSVIAAVLHIIPKGAANGVVPRGNTFSVLAGFGVAAALVLGALVIRPDVQPVIDRMPPWTRDLFRTGAIPTGPPPPA